MFIRNIQHRPFLAKFFVNGIERDIAKIRKGDEFKIYDDKNEHFIMKNVTVDGIRYAEVHSWIANEDGRLLADGVPQIDCTPSFTKGARPAGADEPG